MPIPDINEETLEANDKPNLTIAGGKPAKRLVKLVKPYKTEPYFYNKAVEALDKAKKTTE